MTFYIDDMCRIDKCPNLRTDAPLCDGHMIEAWRWVEAHPVLKPASVLLPLRVDVRPSLHSVVYYARLPHGDVKIGRSVQMRTRMDGLRLEWPSAVLAAEPGGADVETARHRQYADERRPSRTPRQREDFEPSARLVGAHRRSPRAIRRSGQYRGKAGGRQP